jgi:serpin B
MLILLPEADRFTEFERRLSGEYVQGIIDALAPAQVDLSLPRFRVEDSAALKPMLAALGMPDAFSAQHADFSGMDGTRELFISDAFHKAFVAVDEHGTEAAAATAVVMTLGRGSEEPVSMRVDHPFIFLIRDRATGTVLFVGRVLEPQQ